jgi:peptidoglycan hydrolase-like protein with peptidoglycan-binding domain
MVQRELQKQGYVEIGAADGLIGPRITAAIERYRAEHGLRGGNIDPTLNTELGLESPASKGS